MGLESRYIKLFSSALHNCLFQKKPFDEWHAFEYLLLRARYEPTDFILSDCSIIHLERGQHFESVTSLSDRFGWSEKKVRCFLGKLEKLGMISVKGVRKGQLITVEKYGFYQCLGQAEGDQRATRGRPEGNQRATRGRSKNNGIESIESKECKEGKNISPLPPLHRYGEYKHVKLTGEQYKKLVEDFGQELTDGGIKAVDEYCEMNGKSYKNYALTIRKWGITRAREEGKKHGTGSGTETTPQQDYDDWYRRMAEIAGDVRRGSESGTDDFSG